MKTKMDQKLKAAAAQARAECIAARTAAMTVTPEQRAMYSKCSKEELLALIDAYNNLRKQRKLTKDDCEHLHAIMMACKQYDLHTVHGLL